MWRRAFLGIVVVLAIAMGVGAACLVSRLSRWPSDLRTALTAAAPGLTIEAWDVSGAPPQEIVARGVMLANPPGYQRPAALTIQRLQLRCAPWLWAFRGALAADVALEAPHVTLERDRSGRSNWEALRAAMDERHAAAAGLEEGEAAEDDREGGRARARPSSRPPMPALLPSRLVITDGRFDLLDPSLRAEGVVLAIRSVTVQFALDLSGRQPVAPLTATGQFVTAAGQPVGDVRFDIQFSRADRQATGTVRFTHHALADLNPYLASRTPYRIVEGDGEADVRGRITEAQEFWCEMTLTARTLVVAGDEPILGMQPQELLRHLQDPDGVIHLTFEIHGRLTDPQFDFHDQLVRQLERAIRARLAERGVTLPEPAAPPPGRPAGS